jgi:hypothetical protein
MSATDYAIRAALLCCHFQRNFAYLTVSRDAPELDRVGFWLTVHGNFDAICALEWCKLFGNDNQRNRYHWKNVLKDPRDFKQKMLDTHGINDTALERLWKEIKDYRDHFIAHLENEGHTSVPNMNLAHLLVNFYFRRILLDYPAALASHLMPEYIDKYYEACVTEAEHARKYQRGVA